MRRISSRAIPFYIWIVLVGVTWCAVADVCVAEEKARFRVGAWWGGGSTADSAWPDGVPVPKVVMSGNEYWSRLYSFESQAWSVHRLKVSVETACGGIEGFVDVIEQGDSLELDPPALTSAMGSLTFRGVRDAENRRRYTIEVHPQLAWNCDGVADVVDRRRPRAFAVDVGVRALAGPTVLVVEDSLLLRAMPREDSGAENGGHEPTTEPPGRDEEGYFAAKVFFATDRALEEGEGVKFSGLRNESEEMTYGIVEVSIPDSHERGEIESPKWWTIRGRDDPSRYVLILSTSVLANRDTLAGTVRALLSEAGREDVLVFVHGYNVAFDEAAKRTAQLAYDLSFPGAPVLYSWPSRGETSHYLTDEAAVEWTVPHFREFLEFVMTEMGAEDVHVIAHSMGNRALVRALAEFDVDSLPEGAAHLRQIVLAAPDIDAGVFRQLAENFVGKADRVTLYTSKNDKAIKASKEIHDFPRAGGEIVLVDGIDTIDASSVETSFLAHSYFGDSILPDIFAIIKNQLPPTNRFGLEAQSTTGGTYWKLVEGAFPH